MSELVPEPIPEEAAAAKPADRIAVALCLLLVLAAFGVQPLWRVVDDRMRVRRALLQNSGPFPAIRMDGSLTEVDQRSEKGVDPWGHPWARWIRPFLRPATVDMGKTYPGWVEPRVHEFEPYVDVYSVGPNGVVEHGGGDDVLPYGAGDWRAVTCEQARLLLLVLCVLIGGTYALARRVPRVESVKTECVFVVGLALVPALVCSVGVITYYDEFLRALAPLMIWQSKLGLGATLLLSLFLLWSLAVAAVRLRLAPRPTPPR